MTKAIIAIVVIVLVGIGGYYLLNKDADTELTNDNDMTTETGAQDWNMNAAGLGILIVKNGAGAAAQVGDTVAVHYTGTLEDGTVFDSSVGRAPIEFTLGQGLVIPGWEQGILGMQVGEQRKLNIPSELAYGAAGRPPVIPANAVLLFDVELVGIE